MSWRDDEDYYTDLVAAQRGMTEVTLDEDLSVEQADRDALAAKGPLLPFTRPAGSGPTNTMTLRTA